MSKSLNIAESTVKNHLSNIMGKLYVRNRVAAAIRLLHTEKL
ncbi:LuxR C-terminal-related transcriptional regulator [Chloroflexota bacterium]